MSALCRKKSNIVWVAYILPNSVTLCYSSSTLDFKNIRAGLYIINIITAFCLLVIVEQTNLGGKVSGFRFFCSQYHSCNVKSIHHRGTYTMNRLCTLLYLFTSDLLYKTDILSTSDSILFLSEGEHFPPGNIFTSTFVSCFQCSKPKYLFSL